MSEQVFLEEFDRRSLDERLAWHCPPAKWSLAHSRLIVFPDAKTDYWQKTHYGFEADNGHFLRLKWEGDFILSTRVHFTPAHQYDQAGLLVRCSPQCWLKTSVEYEPEGSNRLGAVVTNHGYSDWSTQDYSSSVRELALRIRRERDTFIVEFSEDSGRWTQIRMAHLFLPDGAPVECGLYACSPAAAGFRAEFEFLRIESH
jgi:regulation of enolase protein 1 (concanavalin A-like superfamily)